MFWSAASVFTESQVSVWLVTALCAVRLPANFSADDFERYRWVKTEAINHPAFSVTNAPLLSFSRVEISVKSKKPQKRQVFKIRQEKKDFCQSFISETESLFTFWLIGQLESRNLFSDWLA